MPIELWGSGGERLGGGHALEKLMAEFSGVLPPGTAFEGEWVPEVGSLYVVDLSHQGVPEDWREKFSTSFDAVTARELSAQPCQPGGEEAVPVSTEEMVQVRTVKTIPYYWPPEPTKGTSSILKYPPDDWRFCLRTKGERVVVMHQPGDGYVAMDLRRAELDFRMTQVKLLVERLGHPRVVPAAHYAHNFPQAFAFWKSFPYSASVVARRRTSPYSASTRKGVRTPYWVELPLS